MKDDYTDELLRPGDPLSFEEFVLLWARSDPHLLTTRYEENQHIPLPRRIDVDEEALLQLRQAEAELAKIERWSDEMAAEEAARWYNGAYAEAEDRQMKQSVHRLRLQEMCETVSAWRPPTPEHRGLKRVILKHLRKAIEEHEKWPELPWRKPPDVFKEHRLAAVRKAIEDLRARYELSIENSMRASKWLIELRASLDILPPH
jgi:hypothetical protein